MLIGLFLHISEISRQFFADYSDSFNMHMHVEIFFFICLHFWWWTWVISKGFVFSKARKEHSCFENQGSVLSWLGLSHVIKPFPAIGVAHSSRLMPQCPFRTSPEWILHVSCNHMNNKKSKSISEESWLDFVVVSSPTLLLRLCSLGLLLPLRKQIIQHFSIFQPNQRFLLNQQCLLSPTVHNYGREVAPP